MGPASYLKGANVHERDFRNQILAFPVFFAFCDGAKTVEEDDFFACGNLSRSSATC